MAPAHAHLNLVAGVRMMLFALYHQVVPGAAGRGLAKLHVTVATLAAWVFPAGIGILDSNETPAIAILGSFLVPGAMLIFVATVALNRG